MGTPALSAAALAVSVQSRQGSADMKEGATWTAAVQTLRVKDGKLEKKLTYGCSLTDQGNHISLAQWKQD